MPCRAANPQNPGVEGPPPDNSCFKSPNPLADIDDGRSAGSPDAGGGGAGNTPASSGIRFRFR